MFAALLARKRVNQIIQIIHGLDDGGDRRCAMLQLLLEVFESYVAGDGRCRGRARDVGNGERERSWPGSAFGHGVSTHRRVEFGEELLRAL